MKRSQWKKEIQELAADCVAENERHRKVMEQLTQRRDELDSYARNLENDDLEQVAV